MKRWAMAMFFLLLASCGGVVVIDGSSSTDPGGVPGDDDPDHPTERPDGGADDGGPSEAGAAVYCNAETGPLDAWDGEPDTALCAAWEVCRFIQSDGIWACEPPL